MVTTKLERGEPLEELVKGSLNHTLSIIEMAFSAQFLDDQDADWSLWIVEVFSDYVIVNQRDLGVGEYYRVSMTKTSNDYTFADHEDWEVVELTYQPQSIQEGRVSKDQASRFVESVQGHLELLTESEAAQSPDGPWPIRAIGITANVINENGRRYRPDVLAPAVHALSTHLHESAGQGRCLQLYGEAEHPNMKATRRPFLSEVVVNWTDASFDGTQVLLEGNLLGTALGKDIRAAMLGGVKPGVSQRAYGESVFVEEGDTQIEEPTSLVITGYDLTVEPSDPMASITYFESQHPKENTTMPSKTVEPTAPIEESVQPPAPAPAPEVVTLEDLQHRYPHLVANLSANLEESAKAAFEAELQAQADATAERENLIAERDAAIRKELGLDENADMLATMQEREDQLRKYQENQRKAEVAGAIDVAVAALPYPADVKQTFAESVKADGPQTVEDATAIMERRRTEYDRILSRDRLVQMGMSPDAAPPSDIQVIGPVIESVTGMPEFARASIMMTESLIRRDKFEKRDLFNRPRNVNEVFAAQYLALYDSQHKAHLLHESRLFEEAEQTSDLSLPYSVLRSIVAEAFPQLVTSSIFDFGIMTNSPDKLYFETYTAETGHTATITDEQVANVTHGSWFSLAHARVVVGSVTVEDNGTSTAYDEWDDYLIDYKLGKIYFLSTGSIPADAGGVDVTYQYDAMREGEMTAVQRAKQVLSSITIEAAADRLAIQISDEAVAFSASQLGYDATGRAITGLVAEIRRKIDSHLIYAGLAAAHLVASNSGGTWTQSTDDVDELAEKIGYAKVKVINRYYQPTFALMSVTNGDYLSNSSHATAAGNRPDFEVAANGYVTRVKGLNCYQSTEMPDTKVLVGNRELVQHRVYKAMGIKGPYPSYADAGDGTNKLTDAEQYLAVEYNASATPVNGKGSVVTVA